MENYQSTRKVGFGKNDSLKTLRLRDKFAMSIIPFRFSPLALICKGKTGRGLVALKMLLGSSEDVDSPLLLLSKEPRRLPRLRSKVLP